jgi:hypothetical protein
MSTFSQNLLISSGVGVSVSEVIMGVSTWPQ